VEDNEDGREGLVAFLQGVGVEVEAASEGLQALKLAEQHRPEIVLLDLGLPGMDGYAVAQALRARHPPERMAIMALTGWGAGRDQERTRAAGFDAHLVKPVQPDALLRAIEAVMGRASSP
jgi:CheY-like chemotaxis protein